MYLTLSSTLFSWLFSLWLTVLPTSPLGVPVAFADSTKYAGTAADDGAVGVLTWSDLANATGTGTGDGAWVSTTVAVEASHYLKLSNFGFAIPGGATVNGVQVRIRAIGIVATSGSWVWDKVRLINASGVVGTSNKATGNLPSSFGFTTFGGTSDLWSGEASSIDFNDADAGCALAVITSATVSGDNSAYIDTVEIIVTYTEAASGPTPVRRSVIGSARKLEMELIKKV